MALPRSLNFLRVGTGPHVLELYLDPICPFSAKATRGLDKHVLPLITKGGKYEGKLSVIARLYPQPFHYYSFIVIEALYLFGSKHPESFWPYLLAVYDNQKDFFNVPAQALSMGQARDRLTEIALSVLEEKGALPAGPKSKVFGELRDAMEVRQTADGGMNGGNASLDDIKFLMKVGRQNSIHVTPTALFDGLEEKGVSSSFGQEDWDKFLAGKIGDE